ncbi:MAG: hypothetical protein FWG87_12885 [Defluviitaleaceae bacterium]|nr:hypothetical protein [Defluviitaleaceae bacterium]
MADSRRFTRILSGVSELSDFRGFYNEPIRVIRENPLNPCEALESLKSTKRHAEIIPHIFKHPLNHFM